MENKNSEARRKTQTILHSVNAIFRYIYTKKDYKLPMHKGQGKTQNPLKLAKKVPPIGSSVALAGRYGSQMPAQSEVCCFTGMFCAACFFLKEAGSSCMIGSEKFYLGGEARCFHKRGQTNILLQYIFNGESA